MASMYKHKLPLITSLIFCIIVSVTSRGAIYTPPDVERLTDKFIRIPVNQGYNVFFGGHNIRTTNNGSSTDLVLDKSSGSGLASKNKFYHGFFNAALKLPSGFTSGVVIAFYLSNADVFPKNHDEVDFELLGHEKRKDWVLQTNLYGNGSVSTGREEKVYLWFDPTTGFHDYSILWNSHHIVFLVDNIPVREILSNKAISPVYPSKPMSVYLTIWDGSEWATRGGKYGVDYKYAPFKVSMKDVEVDGCIQQTNVATSCSRKPSSLDPVDGEEFSKLSEKQAAAMDWARRKHMFYAYCKDTGRYKVMPPECKA